MLQTGTEFHADRRFRRPLPTAVVQSLAVLDNQQSLISIATTLVIIAISFVIALNTSGWYFCFILPPLIIVIAAQQQACFVLAHEAAHYRLFRQRRLNDLAGRSLGALVGISMCTYRVVHRLHHNHLYQKQDPDIPLHGGYPRGRGYLLKKLLKDLAGMTAYKTYAYFFGAPAVNNEVDANQRPLDDTSPALRRAAEHDCWLVLIVQAVLFSGAVITGYGLQYILLWLLPAATVLQAILRLRAICEHGAVSSYESPLTAARTNLVPRWLSWLLFPHHVNYHIEHHLYPSIPHYNLPECHRQMQSRGILDKAEVRSIFETLTMIFAAPRSNLSSKAITD